MNKMREKRSGGYLIGKIHRISGRIFAKLMKENNIEEINPAQGRILFTLWKQDGISIGAHSVTHKNFAFLSFEAIAREISMSKEEIETRLGANILAFAYPLGKKVNCNFEASLGALEDNDYKLAVTTIGGMNSFRSLLKKRFCIKRIGSSYDDSLDFLKVKIALSGFWQK